VIKYVVVLAAIINIFAFIDCAVTPQENVRRFPKWGWLLIIFFTGTFGAIAFLVIGRAPRNGGGGKKPKKRILPPDDDPDFLRSI
jgi:hypothetical protein